MLVSCAQMQQIEEDAFARGASARDLMERVGRGMAQHLVQRYPRPGTAVLFLGKGNNAGDALVLGRELAAAGWRLVARTSAPVEAFKPLPQEHWEGLQSTLQTASAPLSPRDLPAGPVLLVDGLLGIGARGPLHGDAGALAEELNALRQATGATTVALDLPSGLDGDTGEPYPGCVRADLTLTVAEIKTGLLADAATPWVGRLVRVPLAELQATEGDPAELLEARSLRSLLPPRPFDTHKGQAGRVWIAAGSPGLFGAAELTSRAALRVGAGLVTLAVTPAAFQVMASRLPPEVMLRRVKDHRELLDDPADALAIGPGLRLPTEAQHGLLQWMLEAGAPAVLDAEALNLLAESGRLLDLKTTVHPKVLTPHPGEWQRLAQSLPEFAELPGRRARAEAFAAAFPPHTLLLKGARTVVANATRPTRFNSSGHPGMATGGMGDVLTGAIAGLIGQGVAAPDAAALGAWLCGRAAELTARDRHPHGTLPTDVIEALPRALSDLQQGLG